MLGKKIPAFAGVLRYGRAKVRWASVRRPSGRPAGRLRKGIKRLRDPNDRDVPNQNAAARKWLSENPDLLTKWLDGVTTIDGKPGLEAVKASLKSS